MNSGLFTVLLAVLFTFGGIGIYSYFQYSIVKKQDVLEKKLFFKNFTFASLGWLSLIIGLILFCVSYFISDETIDYFTKNNIVFDGAHGTMTYFGIILFSLFLYILATSLIYILYIKRLENTKARKYLKWIMWISIPLVILFLLLFEEGIAPFLQYPLANQILFSSNGVELIYSVGKYQTEGFSLSIAFYAIFIILGACLVLYICDYQIYKKYGDHGLITACFFIAFPCGIIGARAWYVIGDWYRFADNPISMFYIWDGGLAIMGGAIFGVIAGVTFMIIRKIYNPRFKKIDYFLLIDFIVPTILVAQAIGRIGNFFNTEVHGEAVSISAWSFLPTFIKNNMHYSSSGDKNHQAFYAMSFGVFLKFYSGMHMRYHYDFTERYAYKDRNSVDILKRYLDSIRMIRNRCCHSNHMISLKLKNSLIFKVPALSGFVGDSNSEFEKTLYFIYSRLDNKESFIKDILKLLRDNESYWKPYCNKHILPISLLEEEVVMPRI